MHMDIQCTTIRTKKWNPIVQFHVHNSDNIISSGKLLLIKCKYLLIKGNFMVHVNCMQSNGVVCTLESPRMPAEQIFSLGVLVSRKDTLNRICTWREKGVYYIYNLPFIHCAHLRSEKNTILLIYNIYSPHFLYWAQGSVHCPSPAHRILTVPTLLSSSHRINFMTKWRW